MILLTWRDYDVIADVIIDHNIDGWSLLLLSQDDIRDIYPLRIGHRAVHRNVIDYYTKV